MTVWASVIAVAGTLLGGLLSWGMQARQARLARREADRVQRHAQMVAAVTDLAVALAAHRRATWVLANRRLAGADDQAVADATETTFVTWEAVSGPLVTVKVLAPSYVDLADAVTQAIWAMQEAPDREALEAHRASAGLAQDRLMRAVSGVVTAGAGGV